MADFPRTVSPVSVTELELPGPLISRSQSGRVTMRSTQQIGRTWTETYLLNTQLTAHKNFLAYVRNVYRNGTSFDISHWDYRTPKGTIGGSPLVNIASQLVTDPENFGAWTVDGTIVRTGSQSDPLGGGAAYLLDSNVGAGDDIHQAITYTGNASKAIAVYAKAGTAATSRLALWSGAVFRHQVNITWTAGVPSLSTVGGAGTLFPVEPIVAYPGWYRLIITANSVVAADGNVIYFYPDIAGGAGTVYLFGMNSWNTTIPMPYRSTTGAPVLTGSYLPIDGATGSVSNWLRAGDLVSATVGSGIGVWEVTADTATDSAGAVNVPINPPIYTGSAPADNAVVTVTGVKMRACIIAPPSMPDTSGQGADYGTLSLQFAETLE